jgi:hypothetical protein
MSPAPLTRVDAICTVDGPGTLLLAEENNRLAQTFFAVASGPHVRVDLDIAKPLGAGGDFVLRLSPVQTTGEGFVPTNDVLAEASVPEASLPLFGSTATFSFAIPFSVVAGTQYALVLTRPSGGTFAWIGREQAPCLGDASFSLDQTGAFTGFDFEFFFTTFVTS